MPRKRSSDEFLAEHPELLEEDLRDRRVVEAVVRMVAPLERYHKFEVSGFERVPEGACIIVANHSAAAVQEILLMLRAWYLRFGDRPARGLAHRAVFSFPWRLMPLFPKLGGVFAHPEVARRVLSQGNALLVFPGGDMEVSRPFTQRHRITLGERAGFVRLAREARVPIVPWVMCGSHSSYVVIPGAERIAEWSRLRKLLGVKAIPMTLGGLVLAVTLANPLLWPFASLAALQALLPFPTRIRSEVLAPVYPGEGESDEEVALRVRDAMQRTMDRLAEERRELRREGLSRFLAARREDLSRFVGRLRQHA